VKTKLAKAIVATLVIFFIWICCAAWHLSFNPWRWFTKVEPGQVWVWDNSNLFETKVDTIWVLRTQGCQVRVKTKLWYGNGRVIETTYKKALFNRPMFRKISK
jgi:hypothetical protein